MARLANRLTRRLLAPIAGLALAGALVAGCAPAPGTAATVNGEVIGESEVAAVVDELSVAGAITPVQAITELIVAPAILEVAAGAGYGVSQTDAAARLDAIAADSGLEPVNASDATLLVIRSLIAKAGMQSDPNAADLATQLNEKLADLDVEISARYGTWEGTGIAPLQPSWLQQPAPDAA